MPRITGIPGPYRFFFTSFDCNEPPHVHVERENSTCKFWLEPIELARSHGFRARELNVIRRIIRARRAAILEACMNTAASNDPRVQDVRVTEDEIIAHLVDGRVISVPLAWSWRLSEATPKQRANLRLIGSGQGVYWPDVDEDISVEGMLHGIPAHRPRSRPAGTRTRAVRDHEPPNERIQPTRGRRRAQTGRRGARG